MTSNYPSDVPPTNLSGVGVPATDDLTTDDLTARNSGQSDMKQDVKEQASGLKQGAADAGQHVAGVAKQETKRVASEAGSQARGLMHTVRDEVAGQASTQQSRVAEGIRAVSSQLSGLAQGQPASGVVGDLVDQAKQRTDSIASWLEQREPADILDEVKRFARQRPGVFIAISAGAGILAGRLAKALTSAAKDERSDYDSSSGTYRTSGQSPERVGMVSPDVVTPGVGTAGLVDDPTVDGSRYSDARTGGGPLGGGLS